MYDDHDDADDVNRTPTAFTRRNYQQPESYKSSLQKHQAHHGHTGKAMIGTGFDKSIADSKALWMTMLMMSIEHQRPFEVLRKIFTNQIFDFLDLKSIGHSLSG